MLEKGIGSSGDLNTNSSEAIQTAWNLTVPFSSVKLITDLGKEI